MIDSHKPRYDQDDEARLHSQLHAPGQRAEVRVATVTPQRPLSVRFVLFVTAAALLALVMSLLGSAAAQQATSERGIHVTGTGVVYGEPDTAVLDIGVSTVAEDVKEALAAADETMNAVRDAVVAAGVAQEDIVTSGLNVWREELSDNEGNPTGTRYRVRHSYRISVRTIDSVGEVLADAVAAGANEVGGISFTLSEPGALAAEARRLALADARERAGGLADAAGVGLGSPTSISEIGAQPVAGFRQAAMLDSASSSVASGQLAITVTVQVSFALNEE